MRVGIIGGGHNGLTLASYLAKEGFEVSVFERRDRVGGLCVNEEIFPGHTVSVAATYFGMFRRRIIEDLRLDSFGLEPYLTDPAEIVLLPDSNFVFTPRDGSEGKISAGDLTDEDLDGWKRFWGDMGKAAALVSPLYFETSTTQAEVIKLLSDNGLSAIAERIFSHSLFDVFDTYCSNPYLKAAAATCTPGFASNPGSVYGCIHHGTAETCGVHGAWGQVRGGMGMVSASLARCAEAHGAKIYLSTPVESIVVERGRAVGVKLVDGKNLAFDVVVSGLDPVTTLSRLLSAEEIPSEIKSHLERPVTNVSAGKVHLKLKRLPAFTALDALSHNYAGIIVVAPPVANVVADAKSVECGEMPSRLMMTMAFPTVTDDTVAPPGQHHMNIDIHCLPVLNGSEPWNEKNKVKILEAVVANLKPHSPDIDEVIEDSYIVAPGDLQTDFGVSTAMCWHLPMNSEYFFEKRNLPGVEPYGSHIENLLLCGAGTYGGGNVTGIAGLNCATRVKALFPSAVGAC
ncbi:MAG: NAD(P)/FAD-dependent oxidoreductase [Candidatus Obscuribacterales bacterium]|nr:NAD(P)/FAD-dependent oxidoreductase [Candidatus Obscuribacterales bacterium]